jgi:hypothetical protein
MNDITIIENFINDEELEEIRQFTGDESLLKPEFCKKYTHSIRYWHFNPGDNCDKKLIVDTRPTLALTHTFKDMLPSVQQILLKIQNKLERCMNRNFKLQRVYLNRQVIGQDVTLHTDDVHPRAYTFLIYIGDITPENYDEVGGDLEFKDPDNTRIEPFTKRAVLFRGDIPHQAYAPLVHGLTRFSLALKIEDITSLYQNVPFTVKYT